MKSSTQEEGNTLKHYSNNCLLLAFISQYTFTNIPESSTNYHEHASLGKGNYSSQSVLEHKIDGLHSSPIRFLGIQTVVGDNLNDRINAIK